MRGIEELELLAKWRGYLEGRALDITKERIGSPFVIDRTLPPEAHDELQMALRAMRTLAALTRNGYTEQAQLLTQHYLAKGELARQRALKAKRALGLTRAILQHQQQQKLDAALVVYDTHRKMCG